MMSWFSSPVYRRYWQHYRQAMAWHQRHRRAYRKALEAAYGPGPGPGHCHEQAFGSYQRYADWEDGESDGQEVQDEEESSSDSEIECDVSNMEISEELRQYFAQTEKHREELSKYTFVVVGQSGEKIAIIHLLCLQRNSSKWRPSNRRVTFQLIRISTAPLGGAVQPHLTSSLARGARQR